MDFWSILCRQNIEKVREEIFLWLDTIKSDEEGKMTKDDIEATIKEKKEIPTCLREEQLYNMLSNMESNRKKTLFSKNEIFRMLLEYLKPNSEYDIIMPIWVSVSLSII